MEKEESCCKNRRVQKEHNCCRKIKKETCCANKIVQEKECCKAIEKQKETSCCSAIKTTNIESCCKQNKFEKECCKAKTISNINNSNEKIKKTECCCCASKKNNSGCCGKINSSTKDIKNKIIFLIISFVMLILSYINIWKIVGLEKIDFLDFGYIAIILCGYPILINAINGLRHKKINSSLLVFVAIIASIILEIICRTTNTSSMHAHSYIFAAGEVAFLMSLGGLIEAWTIKSSRKGIEKLVAMSPKTANILVNGEIKTIKIDDIKIDDIVIVKPNEMIPVDGLIIKGNSAIDSSRVTGEFIPVDVKEGDTVYGGTFNKMGMIEIRVTKESKDMTVNKLIHLSLEAEEQKAPIAKIADKCASYIVPSAICLSILIGILSYFIFDLTWMQALIRGVTILVVFCPCSLTLATPTAVAASIGSGAYNGIIIKSGDALEKLSNVNVLAFDKTGTITEGNIEVKEIISFDEKLNLLQLTASVEKYSEHPIGKAIYKYGLDKSEIKEATNIESEIGVGIKAVVDNNNVKVISLKEAIKEFSNDKNLKSLDKYLDMGYTVVVTICNDKIIGAICLYDTIRKDAEITMEKIKQLNISTIMLTGDNINSAKTIANKCNIDNVKASLMPEEKLEVIKDLQNSNKNVCMIGDGVNDAPALAIADCSIAMGAIGNDVAVETADIAIMNSDIKNVYNTVNLAKKTMFTIKRNIAISMTINAVSIALSLFGILTPITGAIVHNASSIFVVLSSALILKTKYFKNDNKKDTN